MKQATEECITKGHVRGGGDNAKCYTCAGEAYPSVSGSAAQTIAQQNPDRLAQLDMRVKSKALELAVERLANAHSVMVLESPDNSYERNPVMTLKKARWFLDNAIVRAERS